MPRDFLERDLRRALEETARLAAGLGTPAYLVGGAVRDQLLGRGPSTDLDVTVEGDAVVLAQVLTKALTGHGGVELRVHDAFGTATILLESGRIDLATARRESYAGPATLPAVEPATLTEDLLRRDFTVNSLALPLADLDRDAPIDPGGGLADLEAGLLRVHHDASFRDDPTRVLRGVRFEARLGIRFEHGTEALARSAAREGLFGRLSPARLRSELELLFGESFLPGVAWRRLKDLGTLASIGFASDASTLLDGVRRAVDEAWVEATTRTSLVRALFLAALFCEPAEGRSFLAGRLLVDRATAEELAPVEVALSALARTALLPHESAALLRGRSPEALTLIGVAGDTGVLERVRTFVAAQRDLRLAIDGEILVERGFEPGPLVGEALSATLDARLDGRIGPDEELRFALRYLHERET